MKQIADSERKLAATTAQLRSDFPECAELSNPKPVKVADHFQVRRAFVGPELGGDHRPLVTDLILPLPLTKG